MGYPKSTLERIYIAAMKNKFGVTIETTRVFSGDMELVKRNKNPYCSFYFSCSGFAARIKGWGVKRTEEQKIFTEQFNTVCLRLMQDKKIEGHFVKGPGKNEWLYIPLKKKEI